MAKTALAKLLNANRWRVREGKYASEDTDGWNGTFVVPFDGQIWYIMISDGMGFRHLSIHNAQRKRTPTWEEMCRAKDLFFPDDAWIVQYHPPKEEYIDDHPYCLHLWESLNEPMPHPSVVMV